MKLLHLFLALLTTTLFLGCNSDKEQLQVESSISAYSGDTVALQASGALAYSWSQVSGTSVILINANTATPSFIAPDVATQETLVFELEAVTTQTQGENFTLKKQVSVIVLPKSQKEEIVNDTNTSLKSLKLTLEKTSLNIETNTTLKVVATYQDNTAQDVTNQVEWIYEDKLAIDIKNNILKTNHKDINLLLLAKYNNKLSNKVALEIYKEISGHRLPPEPDPTINNSTLLGVDSNDNGVRDDVERWIYEEYKDKHPIHIDIAMQAGRAYKQVLETPERALEIREIVNAPYFCVSYYKNYAELFNASILVNERVDTPVKSKYFNTKERNNIYWEYDTLLSGGSYTLPWPDEMKNFCDFNMSKYEK
jgi:hypothetical protein